MSDQARRDLGKHLQEQLGVVIQRHCDTANVVLGVGDVALLIAEAAVSISLSAAATAAANARPDRREEMFDVTLTLIAGAAQLERPRGLAEVAKRVAK